MGIYGGEERIWDKEAETGVTKRELQMRTADVGLKMDSWVEKKRIWGEEGEFRVGTAEMRGARWGWGRCLLLCACP